MSGHQPRRPWALRAVALAERRYRPALALIVVAAAALRLARLALLWNRPLLLNDSIYYSAQARGIADGRFFLEPFSDYPGAEHGPITSLLMSVVSPIGNAIPWQRAVTVPFGIATVVLIALLARRLAGPAVSLVAAALAAVYPNLWLSDGLVMSESISIAVVVGVLLLATREPDGRLRSSMGLGIAVGIAALVRSELLLLAPLLALAAMSRRSWRDAGRAGVVLAAAAVAVAPWIGFNLSRFEEPVFLTTNEGGLLLGTNSVDTYWGPNTGGWSLLRLIDEMDRVPDIASRDASVRSSHMRSVGLQFAADNWKRLPVVMAARVARLLDVYGLEPQLQQDEGEERGRIGPWIGIAMFWLLAPLAAFGALRWRAIGGRRRHLAVVLAPVAVVLVTAAAFYGTHRLRSSAEPTLVILAAAGIVALATRAGSRVSRP